MRSDFGAVIDSVQVCATFGHPSEDAARERLKRAYRENVIQLTREHSRVARDWGERAQ